MAGAAPAGRTGNNQMPEWISRNNSARGGPAPPAGIWPRARTRTSERPPRAEHSIRRARPLAHATGARGPTLWLWRARIPGRLLIRPNERPLGHGGAKAPRLLARRQPAGARRPAAAATRQASRRQRTVGRRPKSPRGPSELAARAPDDTPTASGRRLATHGPPRPAGGAHEMIHSRQTHTTTMVTTSGRPLCVI